MDLASIARALPNGRVSSGGVSFAAPGHSRTDNSGRVLPSPNLPHGIWVTSLAGDDEMALRDYVLDQLRLPRENRDERRARTSAPLAPRDEAPPRTADPAESERRVRALEIFREARALWDSPAEAYLVRERRLVPFEGLGWSLRFHPECPFGTHRTPAMVALVRDVRTNQPRAIHRTALTLDGRKAAIGGNDRLTLGPVSGGAIKLTPDEDVTLCLGIGEGIESALSLRLLPEFGASPVWSLISANGIARLPVLAGIECLWIAVDRDEAGLKASQTAAARWTDRETILVSPRSNGADLNDLFKGRADA